MPNSPTTAKFLRHGQDRLIAINRLADNNTGTKVCILALSMTSSPLRYL